MGKGVQFLLKQNILFIDIRKDQGNGSLILWILEDSLGDLQVEMALRWICMNFKLSISAVAYLIHGCYTRSTTNHGKMLDHVWHILEGSFGTTHVNEISDLEERKHARHVASGIRLDDQIKAPLFIVQGGWRVAAHDALPVNVESHRNVLADGETQGRVSAGQSEAIQGGVWADVKLLNKREF